MSKIAREIAAALCGAVTMDNTGTVEGSYLFPETFCGFSGHFPGHAILPAIVEIMTVVSLVGAQTGCRQRLVAVDDAKFLTPVEPGQGLTVRCRQRTVRGKELWDARLAVGETTTATMLIELRQAEEAP